MNSTLEFLKNEIADLVDFEPEEMKEDTPLAALELDSLDYVSLQLAVKKKFAVQINFDDFTSGQITSLGQFCSYIEDRMVTA
ncbi:acyl carrier protein [Undibacterium luofuense]|uniref:Acyl carrier protein n=1 Tax=Undibacterium luofuense TaxID=2828733 RepID=A0A941DM31_9BURK|nr:acyl carrier protein [Undibacterium luofuense]MBR7780556.1 acyl carrier protein [Undibacterium luofuense]